MTVKSLRWQLLLSHLMLGSILLAVMLVCVASFFHLGHSIARILKDNYASVIAAENMKETLERQDSAATFYLAGQVETARRQYAENRALFERWDDVEARNITEVGEQQLSDGLEGGYPVYRRELERLLYADPPMGAAEARVYYFSTLEPAFLHLKSLAQGVLDVNQRAIVRADARAETEARIASWAALTATLLAIALAVFLANQSVRQTVKPLQALARQAEEIGSGRLEERIDIHGPSEIAGLAVTFNRMADRLMEARRIEIRRLHRAERMSDTALESLYDPVIVTDAAKSIVRINRAAEALFGPTTDVDSKAIDEVVAEPSISLAIDQVVARGTPYASEGDKALVRLSTAGGSRIYRLRASPMRDDDGTLLGVVAVLEDVTRLRELDRLKSEFISVASHELRTPVTSLQLAVDLLREGAAGPLTTKQSALVEAQREDLERLQRLMRDLLDITRLEAGATPRRFEIVSMNDLVEGAVRNIAPLADERGIAVDAAVDAAPAVWADRDQLSRVVTNLLDNAIRHTDRGGRITVECRLEGENAVVSLADTGAGIPADYLPRIFERFVQVPGATRGGSGLGLSIARAIVEGHGGTIVAESEPGKGSVFTVRLPARKKEEANVSHISC